MLSNKYVIYLILGNIYGNTFSSENISSWDCYIKLQIIGYKEIVVIKIYQI